MAEKAYLAADLGASSGRLVAGLFDGERLRLEEVHRFPNGGVAAAGRLYWDLLGLWRELLDGLRAAAARWGDAACSVGVDTWGVDFGLLGRGDELLGNPAHYRDRRTEGVMERALEVVSREEIFEHTGLQFMQFNTLFQLLAMKWSDSPLLEAAESLLMMPDLFHWLLTGQKANELTEASTTQCYDPRRRRWATELLERFELPTGLLGPIVEPGTRLGPLRRAVADETGLRDVEVVLPGTHDTASAVMAAPAAAPGGGPPSWCYISSGTWSLMGVETAEPVVTARCRELNFTNEGGVGGTTRLLKNIAGLWLVQECRRIWALQGRDYTWDQLVGLAEQARPHVSLINPDDPRFLAPQDMPEAIRGFCRESGQPVPESEGAVIRCALESLALRYRQVLGWLEQLIGGPIDTIHIVGGGVRNRLLSQMAADACGLPVVAGPVEATSIGNLLMQAVAFGDVDSIAAAREVIRRSFELERFEPQHPAPWEEAFERFEGLVIG